MNNLQNRLSTPPNITDTEANAMLQRFTSNNSASYTNMKPQPADSGSSTGFSFSNRNASNPAAAAPVATNGSRVGSPSSLSSTAASPSSFNGSNRVGSGVLAKVAEYAQREGKQPLQTSFSKSSSDEKMGTAYSDSKFGSEARVANNSARNSPSTPPRNSGMSQAPLIQEERRISASAARSAGLLRREEKALTEAGIMEDIAADELRAASSLARKAKAESIRASVDESKSKADTALAKRLDFEAIEKLESGNVSAARSLIRDENRLLERADYLSKKSQNESSQAKRNSVLEAAELRAASLKEREAKLALDRAALLDRKAKSLSAGGSEKLSDRIQKAAEERRANSLPATPEKPRLLSDRIREAVAERNANSPNSSMTLRDAVLASSATLNSQSDRSGFPETPAEVNPILQQIIENRAGTPVKSKSPSPVPRSSFLMRSTRSEPAPLSDHINKLQSLGFIVHRKMYLLQGRYEALYCVDTPSGNRIMVKFPVHDQMSKKPQYELIEDVSRTKVSKCIENGCEFLPEHLMQGFSLYFELNGRALIAALDPFSGSVEYRYYKLNPITPKDRHEHVAVPIVLYTDLISVGYENKLERANQLSVGLLVHHAKKLRDKVDDFMNKLGDFNNKFLEFNEAYRKILNDAGEIISTVTGMLERIERGEYDSIRLQARIDSLKQLYILREIYHQAKRFEKLHQHFKQELRAEISSVSLVIEDQVGKFSKVYSQACEYVLPADNRISRGYGGEEVEVPTQYRAREEMLDVAYTGKPYEVAEEESLGDLAKEINEARAASRRSKTSSRSTNEMIANFNAESIPVGKSATSSQGSVGFTTPNRSRSSNSSNSQNSKKTGFADI